MIQTTDAELIRLIESKTILNKQLVIFVCGYGGAGKTTICRRISSLFPKRAITFETDWYSTFSTTERRKRIATALAAANPELIEQEQNPLNWYDWSRLKFDLNQLASTGHLKITDAWSQASGEKELCIDLQLPNVSEPIVVCDGIYLLHEDVRPLADLIILLDTPISDAVERTNKRDAHRSSSDYLKYKESLLRQYDQPYFEKYSRYANTVLKS